MPRAASALCIWPDASDGGSQPARPSASSSAAAVSVNSDASAITRREAESAASSGTTTSQTAAKEPMPPVNSASVPARIVSDERREDVRALVAAGARQISDDQNRRHQPGEDADLERAGHSARDNVYGEARERDEAAEQARRDEGAMARGRQRILPGRWMDQGVDIVPNWREKTHRPCLTS